MIAHRERLACVLGGIDVVRPLGLAGIRSAVVAGPGDPSRYSRYTKLAIDWIDPWLFPDALVDRLLRFAASQRHAPVLFYDGDWDLLLVSRYRERLSEGFRFVIPDAELVEDLVDKSRFEALARRLGLPVPRAVRPGPGETPDLRFPVVVKPLTRQHATWRPLITAKAVRAESPERMDSLLSDLRAAGVEALVQELVEGPESRIESYHVYVDEDGSVRGEFTGRKLRTYPKEFGYTTALTITNDHDVLELGRDLTARLGLRGVAKFDFKRDGGGELHLLEVNPRFNLWHHPGARAGVNLPELVFSDLAGLPRREPGPVTTGVRWCSLAHDRRAARRDGITLARWLRWALSAEAISPFAWTDPAPLVLGGIARVRRRLSALRDDARSRRAEAVGG